MSEHLPTTDEVRKTYDDGRGWQQMGYARYVPGEFDLWLEQFRAEAKAEAWDEGYIAGHEDARAVQPTYPQPTPNPYRADDIETKETP